MRRPLPGGLAPSVAYFIRQGQWIGFQFQSLSSNALGAKIRVIHVDGTDEILEMPEQTIGVGNVQVPSDSATSDDGVIVGGFVYSAQANAPVLGAVHVQIFIMNSQNFTGSNLQQLIGEGYVAPQRGPTVGKFTELREFAHAKVDVTYTQSIAGSIILELAVAAGGIFRPEAGEIAYTGTNSIVVEKLFTSGGNKIATFDSIASVASATAGLPQDSTANTTSTDSISSIPIETRTFVSGEIFRIRATGAGSGTDTLRLTMDLEIFYAVPTLSQVASGGTWAVSAGSATLTVI